MTTWDNDLAFTIQPQGPSNWCWAATSTSVSIFYDPSNSPWTQCKVANAELGQTTCCQNGSSAACDVPWYLDRALTRTQNLDHAVGNTLSIADLNSEFSGGRPLGTRIGWAGGGGHFMVLAGASSQDSRVHVHDPIYGDQDYDYNSYVSNYQGSGSWTDSYYTQSFTNPAGQGGIQPPVLPAWLQRAMSNADAQQQGSPPVTGKTAPMNSEAHPVFMERLDDLAAGRGLAAAKETGWRRIVTTESGDIYSEEFDPNLTAPRSVSRGPLLAQTLRLTQETRRQFLTANVTRETRFLQIPGIYVFALWLKAPEDRDDLLIPMQPAPLPLVAGTTYQRSAFEPIVEELAKKRLAFDERP